MRKSVYREFWRSENNRQILPKKVLLTTHPPISPILNAADLMNHLDIQGCLGDSFTDYYVTVTSKMLLFHEGSPLLINML